MKKLLVITSALLALLSVLASAQAENSTRERGFSIHHNAVPASMLTPEIATQYKIVRSKFRGLLTVSVIKEIEGTTGQAVKARIEAESTSLIGRTERLELREVIEGNAVYYLASFPITDRDQLKFKLEVIPDGENRPIRASFSQKFFID